MNFEILGNATLFSDLLQIFRHVFGESLVKIGIGVVHDPLEKLTLKYFEAYLGF